MADTPMTVVETEEFLREARPLMSDAERGNLVAFLGANPEAGKIVAETGGLRKFAGDCPAGASAAAQE